MSGTRLRLGAAVLALAIPFGGAAIADAARLKLRSKTVTVGQNPTPATATAKCPAGTKAVGGGFSTSPPFVVPGPPPSLVPIVYESRRIGQRKWRVSAVEGRPPPASGATVTSFAHCRTVASRIKTRASSAAVPVFMAGTTTPSRSTATCPSGTKAIAGGFATVPLDATSSGALIFESFRLTKRKWRVTSVSGRVGTQTAFAYCLAAPAPKVRKAVFNISPPGSSPTLRTPNCKRGLKPAAGGFSLPLADPPAMPSALMFIRSSRRTGKAWSVNAAVGGSGGTLTAFGYCS